VILGHEGFLDFFTAVFDGEHCTLELTPNSGLPLLAGVGDEPAR
jgi:hypothetical protein